MTNEKAILSNSLNKLEKHYIALTEYKALIDDILKEKDLFKINVFKSLVPQEKAVLEAYLKRFSSLQDFLGSKIFSLLLRVAGIGSLKMSEILYHIEKEGIIDNLDNWVSLREARNTLEHAYPDNLQEALNDLKFCIKSFYTLEKYYLNTINFAKKYIKKTVRIPQK